MNRINVLPRSVAELIAAGEVVERPASVIKELCENSIDAGAKSVTVEIRGGGLTFLRVTDNGCGISREDVPLAFVSHATSKVANAGDLDSIFTLGFRGEALASIASVSHVEMLTRTEVENIGTRCCMDGGEQSSLDDAGCPLGTTIVVRDLFYNTPARMKFLKRDVTEATAVAGVVDVLALSHPSVSFRFIRDGKQTLLTPGDGSVDSVSRSVLGKEISASMLPVSYELDGVSVNGLVSSPVSSRASRAMQFFYVNNRFVKTRTAMAALEQAYKGTVMIGKFPACVLYISLNAAAVDANVHPAKTEVRFSDERKVFNAVYYAVKNTVTTLDRARPQADLTASMGNALRRSAASQMKLSQSAAKKSEEFWRNMSQGTQSGEEVISFDDNDSPDSQRQKPKSAFLFDYQLKVEQEAEPPVTAQETETNVQTVETSIGQVSTPASRNEVCGSESLRGSGVYIRPIESFFPPYNGKADDRATSLLTDADESGVKSSRAKSALPVEYDTSADDLGINRAETAHENKHAPIPSQGDKVEIVDEDRAELPITVLGEAFKTYIFVQQGDSVFVIDKHAAHERIIYEQLKSKRDGSTQVLMSPVTVTLGKQEYACALENIGLLEQAGYIIEDFGSGTLRVRECPMYLPYDEIASAVGEMAAYLAEGKTSLETERLAFLLHNSACRAAVKAGDSTPPGEINEFARQVLSRDDIRYCPHGRPVCFEITRRELEKQFGRLQ